eukprot:gene2457-13318_t
MNNIRIQHRHSIPFLIYLTSEDEWGPIQDTILDVVGLSEEELLDNHLGTKRLQFLAESSKQP